MMGEAYMVIYQYKKGALPVLMRATATIGTKVTIITKRLQSLKKNDSKVIDFRGPGYF
jgi:hypothetical protein